VARLSSSEKCLECFAKTGVVVTVAVNDVLGLEMD
jgi:hypothetical protein